jgi:hypothetical protein
VHTRRLHRDDLVAGGPEEKEHGALEGLEYRAEPTKMPKPEAGGGGALFNELTH